MSMSLCIICSDLFDGVERVAAAPCGHVYHSKCLLRWLDEKKSCPECRKRVLKQSVVELYFNINSTVPTFPSNLTVQIENLKTLLEESCASAEEISDKNKRLAETVEKNEQTIHTLQQANMNQEQKLRDFLLERSQLTNSLNLYEMENGKLKKELSLLKSIRTVVTGAQSDADEILNQATNSATQGTDLLIAKRLAYCCSITKRELKRAIDEKNKSRKEAIEITKNLGLTSSKLRLSNATVKKLEKKVQQLESAAKRNMSMNGSEFCDSLNPEPSTSNESPCPKPSKISCEMTPITAGPENKRKRKMNVVVLDKQSEKVSVACKRSVSPIYFSPIASHKKETDSVSSIGYNGLGGHHSVIVPAESASSIYTAYKFTHKSKMKFR